MERLEICIHNVSTIIRHLRTPNRGQELSATIVHYSSLLNELLQCLRNICRECYLDEYQHGLSTSYMAPVVRAHHVGRPRFVITQHQLQYLRSMSFSWVQISQMLSVSLMTIYCRRREFGMLGTPNGSLTDMELNSLLLHLQTEMPALGQTMVWGRLRSMGISVTCERVRCAIRSIDPIQTALRWRGNLVCRQPYSVPGPNSLWHLGKSLLFQLLLTTLSFSHTHSTRWPPQTYKVGDGNTLCN